MCNVWEEFYLVGKTFNGTEGLFFCVCIPPFLQIPHSHLDQNNYGSEIIFSTTSKEFFLKKTKLQNFTHRNIHPSKKIECIPEHEKRIWDLNDTEQQQDENRLTHHGKPPATPCGIHQVDSPLGSKNKMYPRQMRCNSVLVL